MLVDGCVLTSVALVGGGKRAAAVSARRQGLVRGW
jgi:hypothetical protein